MPVHTNSVISTAIKSFDPALYNGLTSKENHSYTTTNPNTTTPITVYQPKYQALSDAIVSYIGVDRHSEISNLFSNSYGYFMMHKMHGTSFNEGSNLNASKLYNIAGLSSIIKTAPTSSFSDYNGSSFPALDSHVIRASTAPATETANIQNIQSRMTTIVKDQTNKLMLSDIPPVGSVTKPEIAQWFFGSGTSDLGFKSLLTQHNINMFVPSSVDTVPPNNLNSTITSKLDGCASKTLSSFPTSSIDSIITNSMNNVMNNPATLDNIISKALSNLLGGNIPISGATPIDIHSTVSNKINTTIPTNLDSLISGILGGSITSRLPNFMPSNIDTILSNKLQSIIPSGGNNSSPNISQSQLNTMISNRCLSIVSSKIEQFISAKITELLASKVATNASNNITV